LYFGRESACPPISDMSGGFQICRDVPKGDITRASLDQLIGDGDERRWHGQSERPRRPEVDRQLKFRRLLDRQFRRFGTL
jgi:hypothetical protein